jgi:hypothetical protein
MQLKDIIMISGKPGLFKIVSRRTNGLVVESLENKLKLSTSPTQKISVLSDIAIFLTEGEIKLNEVFKLMKQKSEEGLMIPDKKSDDATLRTFLETIIKDYDKERVYVSDIKKLVSWWSILKDSLDFETLSQEEEVSEGSETSDNNALDKNKSVKSPINNTKAKAKSGANVSSRSKSTQKTVTNRKQS